LFAPNKLSHFFLLAAQLLLRIYIQKLSSTTMNFPKVTLFKLILAILNLGIKVIECNRAGKENDHQLQRMKTKLGP
jgi:hypothetical protein